MHRHLFHFILLMLLSLLSHSCSSPHTHTIQEAEGIMDQYPDSALSILEDIPREELRGSQARALHALLLTQARSKNYITETNDSLISTAVSYFESTDDSHHLMLSLHYFGELNFNRKAYARSLTALFKAYDLAVRLDDKFWIAMSARMIADIYHENYHTAEEIEFSEIELENFRLAHRQPHINYAILDLAKTYADAKEYPKATQLATQLTDSATKYSDNHLKHIALRTIGTIHLRNQDYLAAIRSFKALRSSNQLNQSDSALLGFAYLKSEFPDSALTLLNRQSIGRGSSNSWLYYNVCMALDSTQAALSVLQGIAMHTDSILRSVMSQNLLGSTKEYYDAQRKIQMANLRFSHLTIIFILTCSFIALSIAIFIFYRYRRNKHKLIEDNIAIAQNLREIIAINDSNSQETIQTLLADRFEILDSLCKILYESPSSVAKKRISDEINFIIFQYSQNAEKLNELELYVNKHHNNIMVRIKEDIPTINESDYRLILYTILGFSNTAIALFLGEPKITAIYDRRKRLKAKLKNLNSSHKAEYLTIISLSTKIK